MSPKKWREIVIQCLYSLEVNTEEAIEIIPLLMGVLHVSRTSVREAYRVAKEIWDGRISFDEQIKNYSTSFDFERIGKVERNILRFALFENSRNQEKKDIINESIRLTKKFASPEAANFVHALLDKAILSDSAEPSLI